MPETRATVSDICAAYWILLGREPDLNGLHDYAKKITEGMTLKALRNSFMASDEFRRSQKKADAQSDCVDQPNHIGQPHEVTQASPASLSDVCVAYRLLLGREPDISGLLDHATKSLKGMSLGMLRNSFLASEEFRASQRHNIVRVEMSDGLFVVVDSAEPEFGHVIYHHRTWEPHIIKLITEHLHPGDVYVDVGANVGVMAFHSARAVGPSGKIFAFEPDQTNASRFLEGVIANSFKNVLLFPFALSDRQDVFSVTGSSNAHLTAPQYGSRLTQSIPGDQVLAGEKRMDFVKIDVEGHEPFALKGLAQTLQRHKPMVLCEFNPRCLKDHGSVDPATFASDLFNITNVLEVIEHDGNRLQVVSVRELMDHW
jgi:FkbM family methyltransferase